MMMMRAMKHGANRYVGQQGRDGMKIEKNKGRS
jgi:hypothetical protein